VLNGDGIFRYEITRLRLFQEADGGLKLSQLVPKYREMGYDTVEGLVARTSTSEPFTSMALSAPAIVFRRPA
jgi:hypothetical protein